MKILVDRWLWFHRLRRDPPSDPPHRSRRDQCRQDDLRRLGRSAGGHAAPPRHLLVRADIADAAAMRQAFETHDPDVVMHLAAESHVDRSIDGPGRFRPHQRRRHLYVAGGGAPALHRPRSRPQSRVPVPSRLHRRSVRRAGPRRRAVHRDHALRSAQPVFLDQGGVRPSGPRLAPHLRPADHGLQHLQQLRPLAVPGEADPAGDAERARRPGAAGLRRRLQHARLDLCR